MLSPKSACELIRALGEVTEKDHFGSDAFSANKRMFVTVWSTEKTANLRLSLKEQQRFLAEDGEAFTALDNAWGRQGWTRANLAFIERALFSEAIRSAYEYSAVKIASTRLKKKTGSKKPKK